jgi:hypothetical protein
LAAHSCAPLPPRIAAAITVALSIMMCSRLHGMFQEQQWRELGLAFSEGTLNSWKKETRTDARAILLDFETSKG